METQQNTITNFKGDLKDVSRVVCLQPISDCGIGFIKT